jgi:hypothetical protein
MVEELEISAVKLAQSRSLARNGKTGGSLRSKPFDYMRLTYKTLKENSIQILTSYKNEDYSETLIQQIDTMNAVASTFLIFASMPAQQNETLNVVEVVELSLDIFNEEHCL